jgi:hypothetical protein
MRNLTLASAVLVLAQCLLADEFTLSLHYGDSSLYFNKHLSYDMVSMNGATSIPIAGMPALPQFSVNIAIPQNMRVRAVDAEPTMKESIAGRFYILPAQPPSSGTADSVPAFVPPSATVYSSHYPYPSQVCQFAAQGSMSGYNIATILARPVNYLPAESTLTLYGEIKVRLSLEAAELGHLPVGNRDSATARNIERDLASSVINPEDLHRFAPTGN